MPEPPVAPAVPNVLPPVVAPPVLDEWTAVAPPVLDLGELVAIGDEQPQIPNSQPSFLSSMNRIWCLDSTA